MDPTESDGPLDPGSRGTGEAGDRAERRGDPTGWEEPGPAPEPEGFTIGELAARAGVTSRTIHYYVAQGLLPGPGKQGPRTRYSPGFLDLLLRIRHLQSERGLSLRTIRQMFEREGLLAPRARVRRRTTRSTRAVAGTVDGQAGPTDRGAIPRGPTASDLLATLQKLVGERRVPSAGSGDRWVTIPISRDLILAGRRLDKEEIQALQRAADYLRFVLLKGDRSGE